MFIYLWMFIFSVDNICDLPFCDDEEHDDEVYFGPVSYQEQKKIDKFGKRKTVVFRPGFRQDHKLMRHTINRSEGQFSF